MQDLSRTDKLHLQAAVGWLELGNWSEADAELECITPSLREHPDVLAVRWQIYARAKKWEACVDIAEAIINLDPSREAPHVKMRPTIMKTEHLRFLLVVTLLVGARDVFAFKEAGNRPYVQSGPSGVFYARCIPETNKGPAGVTEVYRVRKEGDQLVDRYDWYTKHGVILGWSPIAGKVALLAIRKDEPTAADKQVEISIYLGGKLLKSWTTAEFQALGAKVER